MPAAAHPPARVPRQGRVSTRVRHTSPRQGPRAPEHLVERMVVGVIGVVNAFIDRLMREIMPELREKFGARADSVWHALVRHDADPFPLDDIGGQVSLGEQFLKTTFHAVDRQAANDLARTVPVPATAVLRNSAQLEKQWIHNNTELIKLESRARAEVRAVISGPLREGVRPEEVAKKIEERLGVVRSRAEFIARDQTLKLYGQIQEERQQDAGIEEYTWSSSEDERVRPAHAALDGTTQRWDSPPIVDPRTGRREHPGGDFQCRCAAIPILPDELEPESGTRDPRPGNPPEPEDEPISEVRPSIRAPAPELEPPEPEPPPGTTREELELERQRLAAEQAERERARAEAEAERQRVLEEQRAATARAAERERQRRATPRGRLEARIPVVRVPDDVPVAAQQAVAHAVETVDLPGVRGLTMVPTLDANGAYDPGTARMVLQSRRAPLGHPLPDIPRPGELWSISSTAKTEAEAISKTTFHELGHHAHVHENPRFTDRGSAIGLQADRLVAARWNAPDREYLTDYASSPRKPELVRSAEYFAEAFAAYHTEPAWLKRVAPKAYELVEAVLNLRRSAT